MTFLAGALVGGVVGFGIAALLGRRGRHPGMLGPETRSSVATIIAALALVVAAIALARNDGRDRSRSAAKPSGRGTTTSTSATRTGPTSTTTPGTALHATVSVPNVVGQARNLAVTRLEHTELRASVDTLALANVPPGFVISQNPLPASLVAPGTTITLVVSAAT